VSYSILTSTLPCSHETTQPSVLNIALSAFCGFRTAGNPHDFASAASDVLRPCRAATTEQGNHGELAMADVVLLKTAGRGWGLVAPALGVASLSDFVPCHRPCAPSRRSTMAGYKLQLSGNFENIDWLLLSHCQAGYKILLQ
jgi:hypothetical protein